MEIESIDHIVLRVADVQATTSPEMARQTVPGSGNFCVLTSMPMDQVVLRLEAEDVPIGAGPVERAGATGPILSVYFNDPDGNLVEVSNRLG